MNLNDIKNAVDDLIEHHDVKHNENVYVKGTHGGELINGFDVVETNNFTGVFVLDSRGKPAVSSRVVKELEVEIERYREALEFYAGGNHYSDKLYDYKIILLDDGEIARKALEGEE